MEASPLQFRAHGSVEDQGRAGSQPVLKEFTPILDPVLGWIHVAPVSDAD